MVKIINVGLLLGLILSLYACGACSDKPDAFCIEVIGSENKNLLGTVYQLNDIRLYTLRGLDTVKVDFRFSRAWDSTIYITSKRLGWFASGKSQAKKTFYLQFKNTPPDVLYVDVREKNHGTCNYYDYEKVLFNGQRPPINTSTTPFMYVLKK